MAKQRTQDYDVAATFKNGALNVLVVQRNSGRIIAALEIPGAVAPAFAESVAAAITEAQEPPAVAPPPAAKPAKAPAKKKPAGTGTTAKKAK